MNFGGILHYVGTEKHASYMDISFLQFIVDSLSCDLFLLSQYSCFCLEDEKQPRTV